MPSHRQQRLDELVAGLQVRFGPKAIRRARDGAPASVPCIPTSFAELDAALGIGGLPGGRISEISGPASSGKVTLAAKTLAAAHRAREALVAWLDLGRTCDPDYLHRCGLDLERLLVVRPDSGADALAITLHLVESNTLAALVFDSLADLVGLPSGGSTAGAIVPAPAATLDGTLERLATVAAQTETVVIFLSDPSTQYRTLAHVASVRLEIRRERWITRGEDVLGYEGHVQILKHRLGQEGAIVPIRITFDETVQGDGLL